MRCAHWLGLILLGLQATATLSAAEEAAPLPEDAALVVQVHGIERTKDRLMVMLKNALPEQAEAIEANLKSFGDLLEGRQFTGLSADAACYFVFPALPESAEDNPAVAILLPVANYSRFRDGVLKPDEKKAL